MNFFFKYDKTIISRELKALGIVSQITLILKNVIRNILISDSSNLERCNVGKWYSDEFEGLELHFRETK